MKHIKLSPWLLLTLVAFSLLATYSVTYLLKERTSYKSSAAEPSIARRMPVDVGNSYLQMEQGFLRVYGGININPKQGFTVEAFVKPVAKPGDRYVFYKGNGKQASFALFLSTVRNEASGMDTVTYSFSVADVSCTPQTITARKEYKAGELASKWTKLAGVIADDGTLGIYLDYEPLKTEARKVTSFCKGSFPIFVGAKYASETDMEGYFTGGLDDVRISDVADYPVQMKATGQENSAEPKPSEAPVLAKDPTFFLYTFDNGFGNSLGSAYRAIPSMQRVSGGMGVPVVRPGGGGVINGVVPSDPSRDTPGQVAPEPGGGGTSMPMDITPTSPTGPWYE